MASIPGQTMGVGVYTDFLIKEKGLNRLEISLAYMIGTIMISLLLPFDGHLYDNLGSRPMILFIGISLDVSLLISSQSIKIINQIQSFLPNHSDSSIANIVMILV